MGNIGVLHYLNRNIGRCEESVKIRFDERRRYSEKFSLLTKGNTRRKDRSDPIGQRGIATSRIRIDNRGIPGADSLAQTQLTRSTRLGKRTLWALSLSAVAINRPQGFPRQRRRGYNSLAGTRRECPRRHADVAIRPIGSWIGASLAQGLSKNKVGLGGVEFESG